jgi:hypothetical protein
MGQMYGVRAHSVLTYVHICVHFLYMYGYINHVYNKYVTSFMYLNIHDFVLNVYIIYMYVGIRS